MKISLTEMHKQIWQATFRVCIVGFGSMSAVNFSRPLFPCPLK
jgi:hypothetical protein